MKIEFDYSFDKDGFFNNSRRRAALEYAGNIWSNLLNDDFRAIPAGTQFTVTNPNTGTPETIVLDSEIDDLLIFVGSGTLQADNSTVGLKTSDYHLQGCACSNCCYSSTQDSADLSQRGILDPENGFDTDGLLAQAQVNGTDAVGDIFQRRVSSNFRDTGEVTDFEPWVGTISFNPSEDLDWNFEIANTNDSQIDFISVALHEIGHILGIGVAPIFDALGEGGSFVGINALALNDGSGIPLERDLSHIAEGFADDNTLLDPFLNENRSLPSIFDLALLADIGYEITGFNKQGSLPKIATEETEEIIGSDVNDVINALGGDDRIQGNDGDDSISGGVGDDSIFGSAGADILNGGTGLDSLNGGLGQDVINGGADKDLLIGAEDNDLLLGQDGDDEVQGNQGQDTLKGGAGEDILFGQEDNDLLSGNEDDDQIQGGIGNDSLQGNEGNDNLLGQLGNDILSGGTGDDVLVGGGGSDRFFFDRDNGQDIINDFVVGEDTITIAARLGFENGNDLLEAITNTAVTVNPDGLFSEITLSPNNTISIFHEQELTASSFAIVAESGITIDAFNVVDLIPNSSGFDLEFDEPLDIEALDVGDLRLVQTATQEAVAGSLIWERDNLTLSFIASEGILENDRYILTLNSQEDSFISSTNALLDGDRDGVAGGDFVRQFTVAASEPILSLEDINLTPETSQTFDISLNNSADLTQATFTVTYNPDLLEIDDVRLDDDLPDDWSIVTEDLNSAGKATIAVEGTTALNAAQMDFVQLQASVPEDATYGASDLITVEDISLNNGELAAIGDRAIQTVVLTGDVDGDGSYSEVDSYLISQVAVGLSDSFDAFPLHSPLTIADVNQDGVLSALDGFLVATQIED